MTQKRTAGVSRHHKDNAVSVWSFQQTLSGGFRRGSCSCPGLEMGTGFGEVWSTWLYPRWTGAYTHCCRSCRRRSGSWEPRGRWRWGWRGWSSRAAEPCGTPPCRRCSLSGPWSVLQACPSCCCPVHHTQTHTCYLYIPVSGCSANRLWAGGEAFDRPGKLPSVMEGSAKLLD